MNMIYVAVIVVFAVGVHALRQYLMTAEQVPKNHEEFSGKLFKVGQAVVAYRPAKNQATATVIAMPGFLEDHRYFTALYNESDVELLLINSCNYHPPVIPCNPKSCGFFNRLGFQEGSIEYDAAVLNWVAENLVTTNNIRLHGHSRGGAVVLEAIKQQPDLHQASEVVLEAPVLPQAKGYPALELALGTVGLYLLPLTSPIIKRIPAGLYVPLLYRPINNRKAALLGGMFYNPKNYKTIIDNVQFLSEWMDGNDFSIYKNVHKGTILIGEKDTVLDRRSMLASALKGGDNIRVVETKNTSHFVSLDTPEVVPPIERVSNLLVNESV
ncbi:MAG: alpha/beta hydrolase [Gammaproteobacteria bacterium]|nr:alpha/beta hydrolase [Gammaproteobacteria bacterium]